MKQQDCGWGADHEAHPHPGMDNTQCPGVVDGEPVPPAPKKKCARWCGRGCTQAEYDAAVENAKKLAERLGKGWKIRVHENLGWHWGVVSRAGFLKVTPVYDFVKGKRITGYIAWLGEKDFPGGRFTGDGRTPEKAIAAVRVHAEMEHRALTAWLKDAS